MYPDNQERIMAIDWGSKRIGIAISDPMLLFSNPLTTLNNNSDFWSTFLDEFNKYKISIVVVGFPLKFSGEKTDSTEGVEKFIELLSKKIDAKIIKFDERFSSSIAEQQIISSVKSKKKRRDKSLVDKMAAAVILQDYLDSIK